MDTEAEVRHATSRSLGKAINVNPRWFWERPDAWHSITAGLFPVRQAHMVVSGTKRRQ